MEIGATGVSNLAPERAPQSAKPAQSASDSGPSSVGSDHGSKPSAETASAVKESPSVSRSDDRPRDGGVDITV